jgi:hypothetical protein
LATSLTYWAEVGLPDACKQQHAVRGVAANKLGVSYKGNTYLHLVSLLRTAGGRFFATILTNLAAFIVSKALCRTDIMKSSCWPALA